MWYQESLDKESAISMDLKGNVICRKVLEKGVSKDERFNHLQVYDFDREFKLLHRGVILFMLWMKTTINCRQNIFWIMGSINIKMSICWSIGVLWRQMTLLFLIFSFRYTRIKVLSSIV